VRLGITAFLTDRDMAPGAFARAVEERGFDALYLSTPIFRFGPMSPRPW